MEWLASIWIILLNYVLPVLGYKLQNSGYNESQIYVAVKLENLVEFYVPTWSLLLAQSLILIICQTVAIKHSAMTHIFKHMCFKKI